MLLHILILMLNSRRIFNLKLCLANANHNSNLTDLKHTSPIFSFSKRVYNMFKTTKVTQMANVPDSISQLPFRAEPHI